MKTNSDVLRASAQVLNQLLTALNNGPAMLEFDSVELRFIAGKLHTFADEARARETAPKIRPEFAEAVAFYKANPAAAFVDYVKRCEPQSDDAQAMMPVPARSHEFEAALQVTLRQAEALERIADALTARGSTSGG